VIHRPIHEFDHSIQEYSSWNKTIWLQARLVIRQLILCMPNYFTLRIVISRSKSCENWHILVVSLYFQISLFAFRYIP
jgi:hypothetical protein